jgi:hypothetical protein
MKNEKRKTKNEKRKTKNKKRKKKNEKRTKNEKQTTKNENRVNKEGTYPLDSTSFDPKLCISDVSPLFLLPPLKYPRTIGREED